MSAHGLAEEIAASGRARVDDAELTCMLLPLRMVPGITEGGGHSVTTAAIFTYAELLELAAATIDGLPKDPTIYWDPPT